MAVITTAISDRDREIVLPKGGDFTEFEKNPVVPYAHNYYGKPVAKVLWIKEQRGKIVAKFKPAPTEER